MRYIVAPNNDDNQTFEIPDVNSQNELAAAVSVPIQSPYEQLAQYEKASIVPVQTVQPIAQAPQIEQANTDHQYFGAPTIPNFVNIAPAPAYSQTQSDNYSSNLSNNSQPKKSNVSKIIKIVIIIVLAAGVLAGGAFMFNYFLLNNNSVDSITKLRAAEMDNLFAIDKPIPITKYPKFGFIDSNGKVLIEPTYAEIVEQFFGDYAVIKQLDYAANDNYKVIDKSGNVKISVDNESDIKRVTLYNIWVINGKLYDKDLNKISSDDVFVEYRSGGYLAFIDVTRKIIGVMNVRGKVTYSAEYKEDYSYKKNNEMSDLEYYGKNIDISISDISSETSAEFKDIYGVVRVDSKESIINIRTGKVIKSILDGIVKMNNDNIFYIENDSEEKVWVYIQDDKIVYQKEIADRERFMPAYLNFYNPERTILQYEDHSSENNFENDEYYDLNTKKTLAKDSDKLNPSHINDRLRDGYFEYDCEDGIGIKKDDKIVLPCGDKYTSFEELPFMTYEYVKAKTGQHLIIANINKDRVVHIIDLNANAKIMKDFGASTNAFLTTYYREKGLFVSSHKAKDKKSHVYNLISGRSYDFDDSAVSLGGNYVNAYIDNKDVFYNSEFKEIYINKK